MEIANDKRTPLDDRCDFELNVRFGGGKPPQNSQSAAGVPRARPRSFIFISLLALSDTRPGRENKK